MTISCLAWVLVAGCGEKADTPEMTKEEAQKIGKADWSRDWCQEYGWYGDGLCDAFCPQPDPDCEEPQPQDACGGFLGLSCPDGTLCIDNPECDPDHGGADCGGICVPREEACLDPGDPKVHYIASSYDNPQVCQVILFQCAPGQGSFSNPCGCGCLDPDEPEENACEQAGGECLSSPLDVTYAANCEEDYGLQRVDAACPAFNQTCCRPTDELMCGGLAGLRCPDEDMLCIDKPDDGCDPWNGGADCPGVCVTREEYCPNPADPKVHYIGGSYENPGVCQVILFQCEPGQGSFSSQCGCGCIDP